MNFEMIGVLYELHFSQVVCFSYRKGSEAFLFSLANDDDIQFESTLFSKPEQDYLNFILNNQGFGNNIDLRNKYIHGTHSLKETDHITDYIELLKIMTLIIIKINEEFCLRDMHENELYD